jgi:hypothetical protein
VILSSEELGVLFRDFKRSAVRLETHQTYTMPAERPGYERYLAGEPKPEDHNQRWAETIRRNVAAGKTMQRLKVVRRPFTDYTRFLFAWAIPGNVEAGEDYRIVDVTDQAVNIPEQDFWLFDDATVVLLNFHSDGSFLDHELADGAELEKYLTWRNLALSEAVPFGDYRTER